MKKLILILILTLGLIPFMEKGKLNFAGIEKVYADDFGDEDLHDPGDYEYTFKRDDLSEKEIKALEKFLHDIGQDRAPDIDPPNQSQLDHRSVEISPDSYAHFWYQNGQWNATGITGEFPFSHADDPQNVAPDNSPSSEDYEPETMDELDDYFAVNQNYDATLLSALDNELLDNNLLLIRCDVLQSFKNLANQTPPQSVLDRINSLNFNGTNSIWGNPFFIQQIEDAKGTAINMDKFAVKVSTLPTVNNVQLTAPQFLEYIRLNINSFIDNSICSFYPEVYSSISLDDTNLWNSSNPLGALLHLELLDKGSVIVTDYATDHWTVATIRTPVDDDHPVSGNRKWGYTTNSDNTYTFYVSGVDRLTTSTANWAQALFQIPFNSADKLWTSFQTKVADFVTQHSGTATVIKPPTRERPDYNAVSNYMNGNISLQQLKANHGCN